MEIPIFGAVKKNKKAKELIERARDKYSSAEKRLERQRKCTASKLDELGEIKLNIWANDVAEFLKVYKYFKEIRIEGKISTTNQLKVFSEKKLNIEDMKAASVNAMEVIQGGIASLGAGALSGVAAYGGVMMFASTKAGVQIASLSGAAAKNATLAYLGGGSLAAGGAGMAGGTIVLGGIVVIPILLVASSIMSAKADENLAQAEKTYAEAKNAVEKMNILIDFMSHVEVIASNYTHFLCEFRKIYCPLIEEIKKIVNLCSRGGQEIRFEALNINQKKTLQIAWLLTQVLYNILKVPLITKRGDIDPRAQKSLTMAQEITKELTETYYGNGEISSVVLEEMEALNKISETNILDKIKDYLQSTKLFDMLHNLKTSDFTLLNKIIDFLKVCFCSGITGYISLLLVILGIYAIFTSSVIRGVVWLFASYVAYQESQKEEKLSTKITVILIVVVIGYFF